MRDHPPQGGPKACMPKRDRIPSAPSEPVKAAPSTVFPIVGIGASAGGLEAFTELLAHLPLDTGMAFVLVQHLDPLHPSALTQLLARVTAMPVEEATHDMRVRPDHIYVIAPDTQLGIAGGALVQSPRKKARAPNRAIDFFLQALAEDQRERAIGVVLSGTASDGTHGLEAIKAEGGITFAQDESARYDSMPRSAIAAGCVDYVLSPALIALELARIARHPHVAGAPAWSTGNPEADHANAIAHQADASALPSGGSGTPDDGAERARAEADAGTDGGAATSPEAPSAEAFRTILALLRKHCGVDFTLYKSSTIQRRITRRMVLGKHDSATQYAESLRGNKKELDALYSDALISVTSFFRNPETFDVVQHKVLAALQAMPGEEPVRAWVLGCSTGQEAYSIAMAFVEVAENSPHARKLQVFATDLNEALLEKARHGLYAKTLAQDLSPERLKRFFVEEPGGYRITKALREMVVFARQNLISDPPFSRLDLITCRNLLIYLEPSLQKKVFPVFHYALKPHGFLWLGASESIGGFTGLFEPLDRKQKIYIKKAATTPAFVLPVGYQRGERDSPGPLRRVASALQIGAGAEVDGFRAERNAQREADRVTVNQFAPPGVLINADLQILQFRGPTGAYLEPPSGKASFDVLKMAREGLMLPLRTAINRAKKENQTARTENVPVGRNGKTHRVNVEVVPLKNLKERCFLVLFEEAESAGRLAPDPSEGATEVPRPISKREESRRIAELERDLAETRDYLQSVEEQQEAANEELQAANEEGQSANEELQSLNEELETSKEELESTNEELTTVNEEMLNRNAELSRLNSDLTNLSASTKLVIVLLGRDLTIRRFSAQAEKKFHLHASDLGRPIGNIRLNLDLIDLEAVITDVIANVRECEREVQDRDGRWYSLHVRPYLTVDNKVDGAVFVLVDISAIKESQQAVAHARDFAEAIIDTVRDPFLILDAELRVQKANPAFCTTFKISQAKLTGRPLLELDHGQWAVPKLRQLLRTVLPRHTSFNNFELTLNLEHLGRRSLLLNARRLSQDPGHREKILLGIQDVTEALSLQADLRRSENRFRRLFEAAKDGILMLDPATRKITDANPFIVEFLGYTRPQLVGKELWQIGLLKDEAASRQAFRELKKNSFIRYEDLPLETQKGQRREVEFVSNLYREDGHDVIQCNIRDITARKKADAAASQLASIVTSSSDAIIGKDLHGIVTSWNKAAEALFGYTAEQMVGSSIERLIPTARRLEEAKFMRAVNRGKSVARFETERVRKDGRPLQVSVTISPIRDAAGTIVGASNVARDITERKRTEAALSAAQVQLSLYATQLEKMVAVRTAQLSATNRRLVASVESVTQAREKYRSLLQESEFMQTKLRHLTRQFINAQEDERREISRELHDCVVQTLVGINVELTALGRAAEIGVDAVKAKLARTQRLVEKSVSAVHQFARELRPAVLDDLGLIPALHAHMKSVAERKNLKIHLIAAAGVEGLDMARRTVLFRVAQESLTNVVRHAEATEVKLSIKAIRGAFRMEIQDNGKSFQVQQALTPKTNKRLGLLGMRERVEMIGGTFQMDSILGQSTTIRVTVPLTASRVKKLSAQKTTKPIPSP